MNQPLWKNYKWLLIKDKLSVKKDKYIQEKGREATWKFTTNANEAIEIFRDKQSNLIY